MDQIGSRLRNRPADSSPHRTGGTMHCTRGAVVPARCNGRSSLSYQEKKECVLQSPGEAERELLHIPDRSARFEACVIRQNQKVQNAGRSNRIIQLCMADATAVKFSRIKYNLN